LALSSTIIILAVAVAGISLAAAPSTTSQFSLIGLASPATVAESIFVQAPGLPVASTVSYYLDNQRISTQRESPYWLGGQTSGNPNGFSVHTMTLGVHRLGAVATLPDGSHATSNIITLNVIHSINATLSKALTPYPYEMSAQDKSLNAILANVTTLGAPLTAEELGIRKQVLMMYTNWGIDPSLDYANDQSAELARLAPISWKPATTMINGDTLSIIFSPDSPYYQPIPDAWPKVALPADYFHHVQLNTRDMGDGLAYGEVIAGPADPILPIRSEWYSVASTPVTYFFRMPANWALILPAQPAGDSHMVFVDLRSQTFVSTYKTTLDPMSGGPDVLYAGMPTAINSLGDHGGSTASKFAELPVLIQPGEATDLTKPIQHAIGGALERTWAARVYPASARDANILTSTNSCTGRGFTNTGLIPYGGIIQLDPKLDLAKLGLTLPALRILQAMQTYGYYVMDFGCAEFDIYTAITEKELDPYGGLWGYNRNGPGVQNEIEAVITTSTLYVVAPLTKKQ
jgi:hypothetical protein